MFFSSSLGFSIMTCYEKKNNNKSLLYSLKNIQKYYLQDNSDDFYARLTFYEFCKS